MPRSSAVPLPRLLLPCLLLACARIEPPPGGPPDADPPRLIAVRPESLARLPDFDGDVEFEFDEVVSEGGSASQGTGTSDLERLIVVSPTNRIPDVTWRRSRITVRPDEGWRKDRVYRVELLPGVTDLRRNRSDTGAVVTFTTGAPAPSVRLEGQVTDWTSGRPPGEGLVIATLLPDSLPYRGITDSAGRFSLGPLPEGEYIVSGVIDQNRNRRADGREAFDTARVKTRATGPTAVRELWTFVHDTAPPRITTVTMRDSLAAGIELSQPLAPGLRLKPADASVVLLPDSTPVPVKSILPKPLDDSLNAPAPSKADSAAPGAKPDTALRQGAQPPRRPAPTIGPPKPEKPPSRPPLTTQLVVRVGRPWQPGSTYVVSVKGIRNVTGTTGDVRGTLAVPERPAADTTRGRPDSTRTRPDSTRARPDSAGSRPDSAAKRRK